MAVPDDDPVADPRGSAVVTWSVKVQIACDRDDVAFIAVVPVALAFVATSSNLYIITWHCIALQYIALD